jgi:hypothetical protein
LDCNRVAVFQYHRFHRHSDSNLTLESQYGEKEKAPFVGSARTWRDQSELAAALA